MFLLLIEQTYGEFAYFSFVIEMTIQVSYVTVASLKIQKVVVLYYLCAFELNTIVVEL
jgi:uncharacterized membrane protein